VNTLLSAVFAVVVGFAIGIPDAEAAKRIGGGRSVGTQRDSVQQQTAPRPAQAPQPRLSRVLPQPGRGRQRQSLARSSRRPARGWLARCNAFGGAFDRHQVHDVAMISAPCRGHFLHLQDDAQTSATAAPIRTHAVRGRWRRSARGTATDPATVLRRACLLPRLSPQRTISPRASTLKCLRARQAELHAPAGSE